MDKNSHAVSPSACLSGSQAVQAKSIRLEALPCTGGVVNRAVNVKDVLQYTYTYIARQYGETGSSLSRCSLADVSLEKGASSRLQDGRTQRTTTELDR